MAKEVGNSKANGSKVINCTCQHDFQDRTYGNGKRVGCATQKGTKDRPIYRCTVCGKETA